MIWQIRLLILGAAVLLAGFAVKTGLFMHLLERGMPRDSTKSDGDARLLQPIPVTDAKLESLAPRGLTPETGANKAVYSRQGILEKNPFALNPPPAPVEDPKEDLLLTGVVGGTTPFALFKVTEPSKRPVSFTMAKGEQNEWLQVESIDVDSGTVIALLKKPVVRIRNVGVEVVLSFQTHGINRIE